MALLHVNFNSEVLELKVSMDVILPERPCPYESGKWPTLYLLHGLSDDHTVWQRRTRIEWYVEKMNLAVVMPAVERSFYTDMKHGLNYWTFVSEELPAICERMFPLATAREDRFAAGLSMGGYGAIKLGFLQPDRFAAVASLSGAVDMVGLAHSQPHREEKDYFADVFGTLEDLTGSDNDLVSVAQRHLAAGTQMPKVYMACGTEDFLYENNQGFLAAFGEPLQITYEEGPGDHNWDFWDTYIRHVLAWLPIR